MYDCHGQGGNQMFAFAKNQMIATQNPEQCIGGSEKLDAVISVKCMNEESQLWKYDKEVCLKQRKRKSFLNKIPFFVFLESVVDTHC